MTWLIIIAVLVVVIGPVMYLRPSARDKRLTELRMQARKAGLSVRMTHLPKLDPRADERVSAGGETKQPRVPCAAYEKSMRRALQERGEVLLQRLPEHPTVAVNEVLPGWTLQGRSDAVLWQRLSCDGPFLQVLQQVLAKLPEDALGCGFDSRTVACYWLERAPADSDAVPQLAALLAQLSSCLSDRFGPVVHPEEGESAP